MKQTNRVNNELTEGPTTNTTFCSLFLWFAIAVMVGGANGNQKDGAKVSQVSFYIHGVAADVSAADRRLSSKKGCRL